MFLHICGKMETEIRKVYNIYIQYMCTFAYLSLSLFALDSSFVSLYQFDVRLYFSRSVFVYVGGCTDRMHTELNCVYFHRFGRTYSLNVFIDCEPLILKGESTAFLRIKRDEQAHVGKS